MPDCFEISSSTGNYRVEISSGCFQDFLKQNKTIVAICDERFSGDLQQAGVTAIPLHADEMTKNLAAIPAVITALRKAGTTRDTCLLAVGGGIVQDVAAFCAAIYMRGLTWVYAPTTLLGMADSCIGGKSSINVGDYKNIVGTFNPPHLVLVDADFTLTLSVEQKVAGLIEAAKICYCRSAESWNSYLDCQPSLQMDAAATTHVIATSLAAKKWFIEIDEFDHKERLLLNFGHTFGHALEGASHYRVSHGVAVGVGMLCALALGRHLGRNYAAPRVEVMRAHVVELLKAIKELPEVLREIKAIDLFDRFKSDKKHKSDVYRVVMVAADGSVELVSLPKNEATKTQIIAAMDEVLKRF